MRKDVKNISVTKPDMAVVGQERLGLSPFGMLSQLFQQEILRRAQLMSGAYREVPLTLLEEQGTEEKPLAARPPELHLDVEVNVTVEAPEKKGKKPAGQSTGVPAETRVLERVRVLQRELLQSQEITRRVILQSGARQQQMRLSPGGGIWTGARFEPGRSGGTRSPMTRARELPLASAATAAPAEGGWTPRQQPLHPGYPSPGKREPAGGSPAGSILLPDTLRRRRQEILDRQRRNAQISETLGPALEWAVQGEEDSRPGTSERLTRLIEEAVRRTLEENRTRGRERETYGTQRDSQPAAFPKTSGEKGNGSTAPSRFGAAKQPGENGRTGVRSKDRGRSSSPLAPGQKERGQILAEGPSSGESGTSRERATHPKASEPSLGAQEMTSRLIPEAALAEIQRHDRNAHDQESPPPAVGVSDVGGRNAWGPSVLTYSVQGEADPSSAGKGEENRTEAMGFVKGLEAGAPVQEERRRAAAPQEREVERFISKSGEPISKGSSQALSGGEASDRNGEAASEQAPTVKEKIKQGEEGVPETVPRVELESRWKGLDSPIAIPGEKPKKVEGEAQLTYLQKLDDTGWAEERSAVPRQKPSQSPAWEAAPDAEHAGMRVMTELEGDFRQAGALHGRGGGRLPHEAGLPSQAAETSNQARETSRADGDARLSSDWPEDQESGQPWTAVPAAGPSLATEQEQLVHAAPGNGVENTAGPTVPLSSPQATEGGAQLSHRASEDTDSGTGRQAVPPAGTQPVREEEPLVYRTAKETGESAARPADLPAGPRTTAGGAQQPHRASEDADSGTGRQAVLPAGTQPVRKEEPLVYRVSKKTGESTDGQGTSAEIPLPAWGETSLTYRTPEPADRRESQRTSIRETPAQERTAYWSPSSKLSPEGGRTEPAFPLEAIPEPGTEDGQMPQAVPSQKTALSWEPSELTQRQFPPLQEIPAQPKQIPAAKEPESQVQRAVGRPREKPASPRTRSGQEKAGGAVRWQGETVGQSAQGVGVRQDAAEEGEEAILEPVRAELAGALEGIKLPPAVSEGPAEWDLVPLNLAYKAENGGGTEQSPLPAAGRERSPMSPISRDIRITARRGSGSSASTDEAGSTSANSTAAAPEKSGQRGEGARSSLPRSVSQSGRAWTGAPEMTFAQPTWQRQEAAQPGQEPADRLKNGYGKNLPAWARELLEKPAAPALGGGSVTWQASLGSAQGQAAGVPPGAPVPPAGGAVPGGMIQWTAPGARSSAADVTTRPAALAYRERTEREEGPAQQQSPAMSEAEVQKTADKVYRIIEERLRRELRRSGR